MTSRVLSFSDSASKFKAPKPATPRLKDGKQKSNMTKSANISLEDVSIYDSYPEMFFED